MMMKKERHDHWHCTFYVSVFSVIVSLMVVSSLSCILAQFKKAKLEDVKLDGRLCHLPASNEAFWCGILALICSSIAQVLGIVVVVVGGIKSSGVASGGARKVVNKKQSIVMSMVLVISWLSFGIAVMLISGATSMNKRQSYGKGWLDGDCYVVREWVYVVAALMLLINLASILALPIIGFKHISTPATNNYDHDRSIHAQAQAS